MSGRIFIDYGYKLTTPETWYRRLLETFPGDRDRMPSGHTRHCEKRMRWGDGECECGESRRAAAVDERPSVIPDAPWRRG